MSLLIDASRIPVYDMGFLTTAEVVECSATDLIGQYIGHTGPKVKKQLDRGLGKVLFIDEAYRLAEGHFAKEAVDELVDAVTKERYAKKLVIILAGYEADINRLMVTNAGLTSRFPEVINFRSLTSDECTDLLVQELQRNQARLKAKGKHLDTSVVEAQSSAFRTRISRLFGELSPGKDWASARDVKEVSTAVFRKTIQDKEGLATGHFAIKMDVVEGELECMLQERRSRQADAENDKFRFMGQLPPLFAPLNQDMLRPATTVATTASSSKAPEAGKDDAPKGKPDAAQEKRTAAAPREGKEAARDAGVSDAVWEQLQRDRQAEARREKDHEQLVVQARQAARDDDDADRAKVVKRLLAEEEEWRRKHEAARQKLVIMGLCPMKFAWVRQAEGYRCTGGSHYMSDAELEKLM